MKISISLWYLAVIDLRLWDGGLCKVRAKGEETAEERNLWGGRDPRKHRRLLNMYNKYDISLFQYLDCNQLSTCCQDAEKPHHVCCWKREKLRCMWSLLQWFEVTIQNQATVKLKV